MPAWLNGNGITCGVQDCRRKPISMARSLRGFHWMSKDVVDGVWELVLACRQRTGRRERQLQTETRWKEVDDVAGCLWERPSVVPKDWQAKTCGSGHTWE